MDSIVTCEGVTKTFGEGELAVHALKNVNINILPGDFATLAGPSGSGKTTLLNMVGALDLPSSGQVTVAGQKLADMKPAELSDLRLHKIGFVFQSYNLVPVMSASENIEFVLELQGVPAKDRRKLSLEALRDVGLEGLEHRRPAAMSGGQQQRVAVARALVSRPSIVLADEPTANLDSTSAGELIDLMLKLNDEHGTTFLIGTHDPRVLERSRRQINMLDGEVESDTRH